MPPRRRQPDVVFAPVMASQAMRKVDGVLRVVAGKEVAITLVGESGTGKEVLARRVHELSERRKGPFVPINCAAIPEALFESELFGHERGAFTGATELVKGKIEAADGGTLFLDEIGELPFSMQAKLLRFLENLRFMRVGGSKKIDADVRLVFATLRPLDAEVRAGRFRTDLYYRIQGITLRVPPLRDRRADIGPLLAQFLLQLSSRHGVVPPRIGRRAKTVLLAHDWPGNVRELKNVVETLCLLRSGRQVRLVDLPESIRANTTPAALEGRLADASQLIIDVDDGLDEATRRLVARALELEGWNKTRAAARLGISVRTLQRYQASGRIGAVAKGQA